MTRTGTYRMFAVVVVALTFLLAGTAEAGSFNVSKEVANVETSFFTQAWSWLTSLFSETTTVPQDEPQNTTSTCPPTGCPSDSGWGIDPNGGN